VRRVQQIRVVVVEDHPLMRDGVKRAFEKCSDIDIVGEASTGKKAIKLMDSLETDVVLLDLRLPDIDGISVLKQLRVNSPDLKVVILSVFEDEKYVKSALDNGANGYLLKTTGPRKLVEAVRRAMEGFSPLSPEVATKLVSSIQSRRGESSRERLTLREKEIWRLLAQGMSNAEVCKELFISQSTVKFHVGNLFRKLGVKNRVGAVSMAYHSEFFDA